MKVDLSGDIVYAFPNAVQERVAHGRATLTETAAHLVRQHDPGHAAGVLRLLQRHCDRLPALRKLVATLVESRNPRDEQFVRSNGLRAIDLRRQPSKGRLLSLTPTQLWDAAKSGKLPVVETAPKPKPRPTGLLKASSDEIYQRFAGKR